MQQPSPAPRSYIHSYLEQMIRQGASDLYLSYGIPPSLRVHDKIVPLSDTPLNDEHIEAIGQDLLNEEQLDEFDATLELNLAYTFEESSRFRLNFFKQQQHTGIVIRKINTTIPKMEDLNLPKPYADLVMEKRGLILVVGPTGSGKSSSMAAMLGYRNQNGSGHVITIEDPIEFVHEHKGCIFTQREVGMDTYSYGIALKNTLRQRPDIILIGEVRDRETMEYAITFAETGHLCLATLHANNANQAIERVLSFFPKEKHQQVLMNLSMNLRGILSQRLVTTRDGGKAVAVEVMLNKGLIKQLIEEGKVKEIKEMIGKNRDEGMQTFDQSLLELFMAGKITEEMALKESDNPTDLKIKIREHLAKERQASGQEGHLNVQMPQFRV